MNQVQPEPITAELRQALDEQLSAADIELDPGWPNLLSKLDPAAVN